MDNIRDYELARSRPFSEFVILVGAILLFLFSGLGLIFVDTTWQYILLMVLGLVGGMVTIFVSLINLSLEDYKIRIKPKFRMIQNLNDFSITLQYKNRLFGSWQDIKEFSQEESDTAHEIYNRLVGRANAIVVRK